MIRENWGCLDRLSDMNLGALLNLKAAVSCRLEFIGMVTYISVWTGFDHS